MIKAPLRNIKVVLWHKDVAVDDRIAETYTDDNGEYKFTFENGHGIFERTDDVYIRILAMGETYNVFNFSNYRALTHATNIINGDSMTLDLHIALQPETYFLIKTKTWEKSVT